jgi:hypothetical protein
MRRLKYCLHWLQVIIHVVHVPGCNLICFGTHTVCNHPHRCPDPHSPRLHGISSTPSFTLFITHSF